MYMNTLNFALGEDIDALRELVRRFAQERIAPHVAEIDSSNDFPLPLWRELGELGVLGVTLVPELGGARMGHLVQAIAVDEISRQ